MVKFLKKTFKFIKINSTHN